MMLSTMVVGELRVSTRRLRRKSRIPVGRCRKRDQDWHWLAPSPARAIFLTCLHHSSRAETRLFEVLLSFYKLFALSYCCLQALSRNHFAQGFYALHWRPELRFVGISTFTIFAEQFAAQCTTPFPYYTSTLIRSASLSPYTSSSRCSE